MSKRKNKFRKQKSYKTYRPRPAAPAVPAAPIAPVQKQAETVRESGWKNALIHCAYSVLFFIMAEILLKIFTAGINGSSLPYTVLFSIPAGILLYMCGLICRNGTARTAIRAVLMAAISVLYIAVCFVYRQFKVFYDLKTMLAGASDAFGQFSDLAWKLIFSFHGILAIVLYMCMPAGYILLSRFIKDTQVRKKPVFISVLSACLVFMLSHTAVTHDTAVSAAYSSEYSFEKAVRSFGLLTGLRLDLRYASADTASVSFEEVEELKRKGRKDRPVIYGYNRLDFDFDALGRDLRLEYSQEDDDMPETAGEYWTGDETATDYDIGEAFVRDVGIDGVANKDYYFDFEAFGRDLFFENFHATTDGVIEMS